MAINKKDIGKTGSIRYQNTTSDEIQITEDKLKLKLEHYTAKVSRYSDWHTWLGIFVSTLFTLVTADFHDKWGIGSDFYRVVCILCCIGSGLAMVYTIFNACKTDLSVDTFINDCKNVE